MVIGMDRSKNLILKNGEDITENVISCKLNIAKNVYSINIVMEKHIFINLIQSNG